MKLKCVSGVFILALAAPQVVFADIGVDGWNLTIGCSNNGGLTSIFYSQVQNPFNPQPFVVTRNNSMATAAFNFNWSLATGHFRIDAELASEGGSGLPFCGTDNRINFHITQDTLLSIDSEWTYQFNGGIRSTKIRFVVGDAATGNGFWFRGDVGDTVAGDPPTDTFNVAGSVLLTPGSYFVRSIMDLGAVGGSPNSVSTAHGFADITLTTVPEPAALGPLAFAAIMLRKRRSR